MLNHREIIGIIFKVIDDLNRQLDSDSKLKKSITEELMGEKSKLDSLGLINFVINVEQEIEEKYDQKITLFNDHILSTNNNPFNTIDAFANYILELLKKA